jgi:predicted DNA-binding antitoxin AbrB/MazE fold protein
VTLWLGKAKALGPRGIWLYLVFPGLSRVIRVKYEDGVLKPLEPVDLEEGEEVYIVLKTSRERLAQRLYGVAKKRRPDLTREEFLEVIEEIEDESVRGL